MSDKTERLEPLAGLKAESSFTPEHISGVENVITRYPGASTTGFPRAVRELRVRLGCADQAPAIHFVPDAYRLNDDEQEIEIFEVEVTHPIPARKLRDLGNYWAEWDAEADHEWMPILIQIDRFGTHHRRDLAVAYFDGLSAFTAFPALSPPRDEGERA